MSQDKPQNVCPVRQAKHKTVMPNTKNVILRTAYSSRRTSLAFLCKEAQQDDVLSLLRFSSHRECHLKQIGAEREPGIRSIRHVYLEPDFSTLQHKLDHSAAPRKIVNVTYGENIGAVECSQDFLEPVLLGIRNEHDFASRRIFRFRNAFRHQGVALDVFARKRSVEYCSKWVFTQHADAEGLICRVRRLFRPRYEFAEVIQIDGLDLIRARA